MPFDPFAAPGGGASSHSKADPVEQEDRPVPVVSKPVADAADDWESQWSAAAAVSKPVEKPKSAESPAARPKRANTRTAKPEPSREPEPSKTTGAGERPEDTAWWRAASRMMEDMNDAAEKPQPAVSPSAPEPAPDADGGETTPESDSFWDYMDEDDAPDDGSDEPREPEPVRKPMETSPGNGAKPGTPALDGHSEQGMHAPASFDWTLPDEYAQPDPAPAKEKPKPMGRRRRGHPVIMDERPLDERLSDVSDDEDEPPVSRPGGRGFPVRPALITVGVLILVALLAFGGGFLMLHVQAAKAEQAHEAACTALQTMLHRWDAAERDRILLGGSKDAKPNMECPSDTDSAVRRAGMIAKDATAIEKANAKLISERWDKLTKRVDDIMKTNPKASKATLDSLKAIAASERPGAAERLTALEKQVDGLAAKAVSEQKTAVETERRKTAESKAKAEAERKAKEKAEADRKAKEQARQQQQQEQEESTPQYTAPTTPQYVTPVQPQQQQQQSTPKQETTTPTTPSTPSTDDDNADVDM